MVCESIRGLAGWGREVDSKCRAKSRKGFRKGKTQPGLGLKKLPLTASRGMESGSWGRADAVIRGRDNSGWGQRVVGQTVISDWILGTWEQDEQVDKKGRQAGQA